MVMNNLQEYTISNEYLSLSVLNMGCIITNLSYQDQNLVLAYDDYNHYFDNDCYLGIGLIGRYGGRIANANITIDDKNYELEKNFLNHTLHGGIHNFDHAFYDVETTSDSIICKRVDYEGEHGFPGDLTITVVFKLIQNQLKQEVRITTNKKTIINPTNHTYFNLGSKSVLDLKLTLNSKYCYYLDSESIPLKKLLTDESIFAKLNQGCILNDIKIPCDQFELTKFIDHPFTYQDYIKLENEQYELKVSSNVDTCVIYGGNYIGDIKHFINKQEPYDYMGLCIEMQHIPNLISDELVLDVNDEYLYTVMYEVKKK